MDIGKDSIAVIIFEPWIIFFILSLIGICLACKYIYKIIKDYRELKRLDNKIKEKK